MVKQIYITLAVGGLLLGVSGQVLALGTGIPVCSAGEITNQYVDQFRSRDAGEWVGVEDKLAESAYNALKGNYSEANFKTMLKQLSSSEGVAKTNQGTEKVVGEDFELSRCAKNTSDLSSTFNSSVSYPPKEEDRVGMSTSAKDAREDERLSSIEAAGTTGLAKSWLIQTEAAEVAQAISHTKRVLDQASSQMSVMALIMVMQEVARKDLNTRVSLLGDDLTNVGLMALEENM